MSKSIICDIDGVVCDCAARIARYSDYQALERGDYNAFRVSMRAYNTASTDEDIPIKPGIDLIRALYSHHNPKHFTFLTSRGNESRANTLKWLKNHVFDWLTDENLIMRPEQFEREPGIFWEEGEPRFCHIDYKRRETLQILESHDVVMGLDDHQPICDMYHEIGVPSLLVKFPGVDCLSKAGMDSRTMVEKS